MINCIITSSQSTNHYENTQSVMLPAYSGKIQVLPEHAESFFLLQEGNVVIKKENGENEILPIKDGICHFKNNNLVIVS